jgi:hypothetical protein
MNLLLDRGACVKDVHTSSMYVEGNSEDGNESNDGIFKTVLGASISRASPLFVKRLIHEGADIRRKENYYVFSDSGTKYGLEGRGYQRYDGTSHRKLILQFRRNPSTS